MQQIILGETFPLFNLNTYEKGRNVKPFLKWAGGKQQLLPELNKYTPKFYNKYYEAFLGSGALFFYLNPREATIGDINLELINCYLIVKDKVEELIESLKYYLNNSEYFYKIRALNPKNLSDIERASRFIYLNRTCFNGLYRENKKGEFNVPYGNYRNPDIVQEEKLRDVSDRLQKVDIVNGDYREVIKKAKKGDFIYLDPPYYPLGGYSDFKRYHKTFFGEQDHKELAKIYTELDKRGCFVMLSNSDTEFTRNLYKRWSLHVVYAKRLINCDATKRGKIPELIVTNYETDEIDR